MGIVKDILYAVASKHFLPIVKKQAIFPYYHIVKDEKVIHIENLYPYKNISTFTNDVDLLLKYYTPINPLDLLAGKKTPENSFLITFDDGLEEIYSVIFPVLKEKKIKGIFFINPDFVDNKETLYKHDISILISHLKESGFDSKTVGEVASALSIDFSSVPDFISKLKNSKFSERHKVKEVLASLQIDLSKYLRDQKPYITKEQIKEMMADGHLFGGHTMSHPALGQLSFEDQKGQILDSVEWVKKNFSIDYSLFAFPFSDKNISKKLITELFEYDKNMLIFGNAGIKQDIDKRIIQRFSLENPNRITEKQIVTENLYKYYNKLIGKYNIKRR